MNDKVKLPPLLETDDQWSISAGESVPVIVRIEGSSIISTGKYFHKVDKWTITGYCGDWVPIEWWPIPEPNTGNKVPTKLTNKE